MNIYFIYILSVCKGSDISNILTSAIYKEKICCVKISREKKK